MELYFITRRNRHKFRWRPIEVLTRKIYNITLPTSQRINGRDKRPVVVH